MGTIGMLTSLRHQVGMLFILAVGVVASGVSAAAPEIADLPSTVGKAPSPPPGTKPDELAVARGKTLYAQLGCPACHGFLGTGGPNNAADLGQSGVAVQDDGGKGLSFFLIKGRPARGMPPASRQLTAAEAADLSARFRWVGFSEASLAGIYGGVAPPLALGGQNLSVLVGDAKYGRQFFNGPVGKCSTCHAVDEGQKSPADNLAHIATKYPDPKDLQDNMLLMSRPSPPALDNTVTVRISFRDGRTVAGYLVGVSDFKVIYRNDSGEEIVVPRENGEPNVVLIDQLQAHVDLLEQYQDDDIHNLTAYLATLK